MQPSGVRGDACTYNRQQCLVQWLAECAALLNVKAVMAAVHSLPASPAEYMPTRAQLIAAGRHDLVHALQVCHVVWDEVICI